MSEEGGFKFYGINGEPNLFAYPHCETDRFWRTSLGLTPERYYKHNQGAYDECRNAFIKPKKPVYLDVLDNLHKKADFA